MAEPSNLVAEAREPGTAEGRLIELASGSDVEAAAVAAGRLVRAAMESAGSAIARATDPAAEVGAALGLVLDALRLVPGSVAAMGSEEVGQALAAAGWSTDTRSLLALVGLVDSVVEQQPPRVRETVRSLAPEWSGSLLELIEAAVALEVQPPPA